MSAVDAIQNIEVPTEITFKMIAPQPSQSHQPVPTDTESLNQVATAVLIPRVTSGRVFKRVKPKKVGQPKGLLMKFRRTKSADECQHSDQVSSGDDESSSFPGQHFRAPKGLSLSLSALAM